MLLLGERKLASLTEAREPRRVLDDIFDQQVAYCLERKYWNFGYRSVSIDSSSTITPGFGFTRAFRIPNDWVRTRRLSSSPTLEPPLIQVAEESGYWYANLTPIYVQYNSKDPLYGMNFGLWPASFTDYVAHRFARIAAPRIPGKAELLDGPNGLIKQENDAYKVSAAICAMNEAIGFAPQGAWSRSRRGWMSGGMPGPGGDEPSGGGLIP